VKLSIRREERIMFNAKFIGELQAGITPLDFLSWWMVALGNTPLPAFTAAGST
jgi:hypothetical protein